MKKHVPLIALLLSGSFFLFFYYGSVLVEPGRYLFSDSGDGLKAYYVYQYHLVNDTSLTQTKALNYPYGESHIYTDGQPLFSNTLKLLLPFFPGAAGYSIAIINLFMILSLPMCVLLLYGIFRKLLISAWYSLLAALCISILAPQVFRMTGHISLSYCFFIPLIWYLLILSRTSARRGLYTALLIVTLTLSAFVHGYYLWMGALFVLCVGVVSILQNGKRALNDFQWLHLLLQVVLPVLLFSVYLNIYDNHTDRTADPYGLLHYRANVTTVFVPNHGPFRNFFFAIRDFQYQQWEGWAYIGTPMLLVLVYSFRKIFRYALRKRFRLILKPVLPAILQPAIWAAALILMYSFAFPFRAGMMFLPDVLPFLKQFRALGRFAWVFYFVFTVYGMYIFYLLIRKLRQKKRFKTAFASGLLFFGILFWEGLSYHSDVAPTLTRSLNGFNTENLSAEFRDGLVKIDPLKYQAILPLPFYHIGSEIPETRIGTDSSMRVSMLTAFHKDLPIIASSSARTSQSEARKILQLFSAPGTKKTIAADFLNKKPLLITYTGETLPDDEYTLLKRSIPIYTSRHLILYELPLDSLF